MVRRFLTSACLLSLLSALPGLCQNLADLAKKEREKQQGKPRKVYTNEDLSKYEDQRSSTPPTPAAQSPSTEKSATAATSEPDDSSERTWSKRFIEAKARVQESKSQADALQAKLTDLNMKLLRQSDVLDRENVYGPLIAQAKKQIEENKAEAAAAQQGLDNLREELRKSGNPVSWENSEAALKPDPKEAAKPEEPKIKDQKYWQDKLTVIDKRYNAVITPLETERFQLINRRSLKEGETPTAPGQLGMGAPPRVLDIDVQIKELNQKRTQEKQELVNQAIREGALPGWFR